MFFHEIYGAYFSAMAEILKNAADHRTDIKEMRQIIAKHAFSESAVTIEQCIKDEKWQLITADGDTMIEHAPSVPLTLLEKRWLRAIMDDPRIRLFGDEFPDLSDTEPLFSQDDIIVFDKYSDGDPYEDENYVKIFRQVLDAVRSGYSLRVRTVSRKGTVTETDFNPKLIEYSEKDDKFRVTGYGGRYGNTMNIARILSCERTGNTNDTSEFKRKKTRTLEFDLTDERKALERVMLHFAHFEKQAVRTGDKTYHVTLKYDRDDETEMVIRILSFGPMIKVTAPDRFIDLIKQRLIRQKRQVW